MILNQSTPHRNPSVKQRLVLNLESRTGIVTSFNISVSYLILEGDPFGRGHFLTISDNIWQILNSAFRMNFDNYLKS